MNYEKFEITPEIFAKIADVTLADVMESAKAIDDAFIVEYTAKYGNDDLNTIADECDEHIYNTLKCFSDFYDGKALGLILSGFLHLALTAICTADYQIEVLKVESEAEEISGGE